VQRPPSATFAQRANRSLSLKRLLTQSALCSNVQLDSPRELGLGSLRELRLGGPLPSPGNVREAAEMQSGFRAAPAAH